MGVEVDGDEGNIMHAHPICRPSRIEAMSFIDSRESRWL